MPLRHFLPFPRFLLHLAFAAWLAGLAAGAGAAQRALLVGVSELVNQPPALWLQAPRNDVILMRRTLRAHGFAPQDITVLADGVDGAALPEARQIEDALADLLARSREGDFVLLYFSGHGTRVRDPAKRYQEPDGLAENFLARDVRGAFGGGSAAAGLSGGMRDVDFDGWISAFLARGVFVWSVFDTCSAASMTRSVSQAASAVAAGPADDEVRFRGVRADQLASGQGGQGSVPAAAAPPPADGPAVPRARYVAFFASESHQVTPELRLPRGDRAAQPHGLLTWAVSEALARRPATWRDLFNGVLALYPPVIGELEARFPTRELPSPVAEGNLDLAVFGNSLAPLSTRPVWQAQRSGGSLSLELGALDGLAAGQAVRVLATQADGTVREVQARLERVEAATARLPVPPALADEAGAAQTLQTVQWSLVPQEAPETAVLRVAAERLPDGIALDYPSAIQRVNAGAGDADLRVNRGAGGVQRVDVLSPALADVLGVPVGAAVPGEASSAASARERLQTLARLKWLAQLHALAQDGRVDGFEAVLEVWQGERLVRSAALHDAGALAAPGGGERAVLNVRNASGQSLDLVVVGIDAHGGLHPVFPADAGETNRFERGTSERPAAKRFELPWLGGGAGRVLAVATPAAPHSAPRLFGAGPGEAFADLRVRGQPRPDRTRQVFAAMAGWAPAR